MQTGKNQAKFLAESKGYWILEERGQTRLELFEPWTAKHQAEAKKFRVDSIQVNPTALRDVANVEFLLSLLGLKHVHLALARPIDLRGLERMEGLESLNIMGAVVSVKHDPRPMVDLSKLRRLTRSQILLSPPVRSILKCENLTDLWLWNGHDISFDLAMTKEGAAGFKTWLKEQHVDLDLSELGKLRTLHLTQFPQLRDLDLSQQRDLEWMHLEAIPKLQSITFHPSAKLRSLKIGGCGTYRIDYGRLIDSMEELELVGPIRFPLEEIGQLTNLRSLHLKSINKLPSLEFLLKMKHLREFTQFSPSVGKSMSAENRAIVEQINARMAS